MTTTTAASRGSLGHAAVSDVMDRKLAPPRTSKAAPYCLKLIRYDEEDVYFSYEDLEADMDVYFGSILHVPILKQESCLFQLELVRNYISQHGFITKQSRGMYGRIKDLVLWNYSTSQLVQGAEWGMPVVPIHIRNESGADQSGKKLMARIDAAFMSDRRYKQMFHHMIGELSDAQAVVKEYQHAFYLLKRLCVFMDYLNMKVRSDARRAGQTIGNESDLERQILIQTIDHDLSHFQPTREDKYLAEFSAQVLHQCIKMTATKWLDATLQPTRSDGNIQVYAVHCAPQKLGSAIVQQQVDESKTGPIAEFQYTIRVLQFFREMVLQYCTLFKNPEQRPSFTSASSTSSQVSTSTSTAPLTASSSNAATTITTDIKSNT